MKAYSNKNLIVPKTIVLNEALDKVLSEIDPYWEGRTEKVTSGVRTPEDQIRIIRTYLKAKGLHQKYPEAMTCDTRHKWSDEDEFVWQKAWSALLNVGVIINPPYPAIVLMDYIRNGVNKKGQRIGQSPHTRGTAFDLSGLDSLDIIKKLLVEKKIKSYLVERENNCIHIDIL
jgi:hypothetical protein